MSERLAANSRGRVPPRSSWRVRSASSPRSCAYRGCRCCPGSSPAAPDPLLIIRRVPGSLFQVIDSIDRDRTGRRLAFFLAARHQSTAANVPRPPSASSPARSAADHDQIPCATGSGAGSGRISAGRHALVRVGDAALACAPPKPLGRRCRAASRGPAAAQHRPHVLGRTRRQPRTAAAPGRRLAPAGAFPPGWVTPELDAPLPPSGPTADQGAARVNGQGKRPGI